MESIPHGTPEASRTETPSGQINVHKVYYYYVYETSKKCWNINFMRMRRKMINDYNNMIVFGVKLIVLRSVTNLCGQYTKIILSIHINFKKEIKISLNIFRYRHEFCFLLVSRDCSFWGYIDSTTRQNIKIFFCTLFVKDSAVNQACQLFLMECYT